MKKEILAIYGGTFSPPHRGHIRAAESFLEAVSPDRLLILPASIPPHKCPVAGASAEDRLAMCRIAFSQLPRVEISDLELRRAGKSYTVLSLRELTAPDRELVMLVGTDMLLTLDSWYMAEEIFSLAKIAVMRRESDPETSQRIDDTCRHYRERFGAKIISVNAPAIEISSTRIREMIRGGENVEEYITPEIEEYIRACGLYRD